MAAGRGLEGRVVGRLLIADILRLVVWVVLVVDGLNMLLDNSLVTLALVSLLSGCGLQVFSLHFPERFLPVGLEPVEQLLAEVVVAEAALKRLYDRVDDVLVEFISPLRDIIGVVHL